MKEEQTIRDTARITSGDRKITISTGNTKTGLPSFNLLAGSDTEIYNGLIPATLRDAVAAVGVCGTCKSDCPGCYAKRMTRNPAPLLAYIDNTIVVKTRQYEKLYNAVAAFLTINEPRRFRIHDSGDFTELEYMEVWDKLARDFPETVFYCYTKRIDLIKAFSEKHGRRPALVISVSTWPGICEESDLIAFGVADLPRFEYDDGSRPELVNVPHCPAVDKDGKRTGVTCAQCKHCSRAKCGEKWAVYAH